MVYNKRNSRLVLGTVGVLLVASVVYGAVEVVGSKNGNTLATVGNTQITKQDLYNAMLNQYGKATLDNLVVNNLLSLEAKSKGITVTKSEVQSNLQKVELQYGGIQGLQANLAQQGKTLSRLKSSIVTYLLLNKLVGATIKVTHSDLVSFYNKFKLNYVVPEQVKLSNILVRNLSTAKKVENDLSLGDPFSSLAKEYSIDKVSSKNGGNIGYFSRSTMNPALSNTAFSMRIGQISNPVKTQFGYNIMKVTGIKQSYTPTLSSIASKVRNDYVSQQVQLVYPNWLKQQGVKYNITDTLDPKFLN